MSTDRSQMPDRTPERKDEIAKPELAPELVIVTGPAGAGRTTAIHALEDFGFEAIDNLPLEFVRRLVAPEFSLPRPLAIGVDMRTRDFSPEGVLALVADLAEEGRVRPTLLYLDCAPDRLIARFSETRRRHPLSTDNSPRDGIVREQALLARLRDRANVLIDTTFLSPHDLRRELASWFSDSASTELSVLLQSFSYKRGLPRGADMVLDLRFLRNPHWVPDLRELDGRDPKVGAHVAEDPIFATFFQQTMGLLSTLLPAYRTEGKAYFALAFGCTGGQHRSVFLTEKVAGVLEQAGWRVAIRHRELEARGVIRSSAHG